MSFGDINRVNTNLQAMSSQFSLNKINERMADTQLKLSTGLRINKAEDDAAGFSIASKLSGRIAGLEQASRNVGDAKSMLDIAETGLDSVMDILVEMKSLATQGANDTLGTDERGYIKDQIEALGVEINDIASQATYQGTDLMAAGTLTFQVGEGASDTMSVTTVNSHADGLFTAGTAVSAVDATTTFTLTDATQGNFNTLLGEVDTAIGTLASTVNKVGIDQKSLSIRQENLSQQITSNSAARSRIQDADFAKVQSESIKLQIMQQTATSALAQANSSPQSVLGFLGQ